MADRRASGVAPDTTTPAPAGEAGTRLDAVAKLIERWDHRAGMLDDGTGTTMCAVRAQTLRECATQVRVALGEENDDA